MTSTQERGRRGGNLSDVHEQQVDHDGLMPAALNKWCVHNKVKSIFDITVTCYRIYEILVIVFLNLLFREGQITHGYTP